MADSSQVDDVVQVTTTTAGRRDAEALATTLVERELAACAQVVGPVASVYRWQGTVERAEEWVLVAKTTAKLAPAVVDAIRAAHTYDTPEVLVTSVVGGYAPYLDWVRSSVTG